MIESSTSTLSPPSTEHEKELQAKYSAYRGVDPDYRHAGQEAIDRWLDWKFGLRIHWGPYCMVGQNNESWVLVRDGAGPTLREQYESLAETWNPAAFDAEEWCNLMVRAGIRFFTFTSKHHDGFSMYDTATKVTRRYVHRGTDAGKVVDCDLHYSIMETPFRRNILGELLQAGRRRDLGLGVYFSHIDWFDSDFRMDPRSYQHDAEYTRQTDPAGYARMVARHRQQLIELCSNYGPIDILSLDMGFPGGEPIWGLGTKQGLRGDFVETTKIIRRLQPSVLIRQRGVGNYGDYRTPECYVPSDPRTALAEFDMPWQVIYPGGEVFSFRWNDSYKSTEWILHNLIDIVSKGGNFQVGYGPRPDGTWDREIVDRLEETGQWLSVNGEAIYGTRPYHVFREGEHIRFTQSKDGRTVYAHVLHWPDARFDGGALHLTSVRARSGSPVRMLGLDHNFEYTQNEKELVITIPEWFRDPTKRPCDLVYVFEIQRDEV